MFFSGKSHALHKRVEQLCTRAIRWAELKRKSKVFAIFCVLKVTYPVHVKILPEPARVYPGSNGQPSFTHLYFIRLYENNVIKIEADI